MTYSPALIITIGMVGEASPASSSSVIANALAIVSGGSGGLIAGSGLLPFAAETLNHEGLRTTRVGLRSFFSCLSYFCVFVLRALHYQFEVEYSVGR